jgi:hypothetical protein
MNRTRISTLCLVAVASASLSLPLLAQEATPDDWMILPQPQTVAQQKAAQAEADALAAAEAPAAAPRRKTRAEVRAELAQAQRDGSFAQIGAEAWVFDPPSAAPVTRYASRTR